MAKQRSIKAFVLAFAMAALYCTLLVAQVNPQKSSGAERAISSEIITLGAGESKCNGYCARPAGAKAAPGLILIHEWWGLNDWVKKQADRYARLGYVVIAPDLYHGEVAKDAEHAHELMRGLADERAVSDMKAAFEYLLKHKQVGGKPVGIIGWCMGGGLALKLAMAEPRLACTVICYGKPVTDVAQLKKIRGPILGIWGATDRGIDIEPFKKALDEAGVKHKHHVYPGAGHAFLNETNQRGYNPEQAKKAWVEIDAALMKWLQQSGKEAVVPESDHQCLIISVPGDEPLKTLNGQKIDIMTIEDALIEAVARSNSGEFDGNGMGENELSLFLYGPSADRLFDSVRGYLRTIQWPEGTRAIKRYGEPGAKESIVPASQF